MSPVEGGVDVSLVLLVATEEAVSVMVEVGGNGWCGDDESDIPVSLFPKHVVGLHADGDMALLQVGTKLIQQIF